MSRFFIFVNKVHALNAERSINLNALQLIFKVFFLKLRIKLLNQKNEASKRNANYIFKKSISITYTI